MDSLSPPYFLAILQFTYVVQMYGVGIHFPSWPYLASLCILAKGFYFCSFFLGDSVAETDFMRNEAYKDSVSMLLSNQRSFCRPDHVQSFTSDQQPLCRPDQFSLSILQLSLSLQTPPSPCVTSSATLPSLAPPLPFP